MFITGKNWILGIISASIYNFYLYWGITVVENIGSVHHCISGYNWAALPPVFSSISMLYSMFCTYLHHSLFCCTEVLCCITLVKSDNFGISSTYFQTILCLGACCCPEHWFFLSRLIKECFGNTSDCNFTYFLSYSLFFCSEGLCYLPLFQNFNLGSISIHFST